MPLPWAKMRPMLQRKELEQQRLPVKAQLLPRNPQRLLLKEACPRWALSWGRQLAAWLAALLAGNLDAQSGAIPARILAAWWEAWAAHILAVLEPARYPGP